MLILTYLLMMTSLTLTSSCGSGATEDLETVVRGRCVQYKSLVNPQAVCQPGEEVNCSAVSDSFIQAFAGKAPCNVSMARYNAFLAGTNHVIPADKSIFWDNVYVFVHRYSQGGLRRTTLEDTLTGYMVDGLRFCSSPNEEGGIGGPNTQFCPSYDQTENCSYNAEASFWSSASMNFASKARGTITIMLNASTTVGYTDSSYFGTWELPNLVSDVVTHADIWLVHEPGHVVRHTCGSSSIQLLTRRLSAKNIPSSCFENPGDVLWLLCWDHQDDPQCQALATSGTGKSVAVATTLSFILSLIALLYCVE